MKKEIADYNYSQLVHFLRYEAGSSNPDYFHATEKGGMKLQQVPEEYARLLMFFRDSEIKSYLELGIGNGGSFAMNCLFLGKRLKEAVAVDNLAYGDLIGQNEPEIKERIEEVTKLIHTKPVFHNSTTDKYFEQLKEGKRFDCIFIDADHSYEGARRDWDNALKHIAMGGYIVFHDINSQACPGIVRLWKEAKGRANSSFEFIHSSTCGIGVVKL